MAGDERRRTWNHIKLHNNGLYFNPEHGDIICVRSSPDGVPPEEARVNIAHRVVHHSPSGFEWGYEGSGPSELALNILDLYLPPNWQNPHSKQRTQGVIKVAGGTYVSAAAWDYHQRFKRQFIAAIPREGGVIPGWRIKMFLHHNNVQWTDNIWFREGL